jgi:hypothetical protein
VSRIRDELDTVVGAFRERRLDRIITVSMTQPDHA